MPHSVGSEARFLHIAMRNHSRRKSRQARAQIRKTFSKSNFFVLCVEIGFTSIAPLRATGSHEGVTILIYC